MKVHEWVLICAFVIISNILTLHVSKNPVKVVDLAVLLDSYRLELLEKYKDKAISEEAAEAMHKEYMDRVLKELHGEKEVIFIKQAVLGGPYEDITESIRNNAK